MKATQKLHDSGQSLWLDNITRELLTSGTLKRYIDTLSVTGLTSNPTIFDHAISKSAAYDQDIRALTKSGLPREDLFFKLAIANLQRAAYCSGRSMKAPPASTAGSHSKCRTCCPTTPRALSGRQSSFTRKRHGQTSSSRYPARRKIYRGSTRRLSAA